MNRSIHVEVKPDLKFYCPVCGMSVGGSDRCRHLLFVFNIYGEFYDVDEEMLHLTDLWEDEDFADRMDYEDFGIMDYIEKHMPKTAVLFGFDVKETGDMWYVCIDFGK